MNPSLVLEDGPRHVSFPWNSSCIERIGRDLTSIVRIYLQTLLQMLQIVPIDLIQVYHLLSTLNNVCDSGHPKPCSCD